MCVPTYVPRYACISGAAFTTHRRAGSYLEQVEAARREFPIDDYGVSQTSLEQVFVRFAQQQAAALPPSLADAAPRRSCELSPASSMRERE